MSYAAPIAPLIEAPINLDAVLQRIQVALAAKLPWLDYSFGRAHAAERAADDGLRPITYPEVYVGNGQYQSVEPNNHYAAHSFLQVAGPERPKEYDKFAHNFYEAPVELIFLFDLDKVKLKMGYVYGHRFTEELKNQIRKALALLPEVNAITAIHEEAAEVFKGYSFNHLQRQTFKHPYGGFKFAVEVSYLETC